MKPIDWNAKVKEALDRTDILALSTIGEDGTWTSPVKYSLGPKLKLSFESKMNTQHVTNILRDRRVSLAIYNPEPFPDGGNLALQIKGTARLLTAGDEGWNTFEITPNELWCFDSRVSDKREQIDLGKLELNRR